MPSNGSSSGAAVWAILRKECRSEWRTRYGLNAVIMIVLILGVIALVEAGAGPADYMESAFRALWAEERDIADRSVLSEFAKTLPHDRPVVTVCAKGRTSLLAAEALRDVPSVAGVVNTPLGSAEGRRVRGDVVVVPVLRAGLGMLDAVLELLPAARVGHIGLQRDEATAIASRYYSKLPPHLSDSYVLMIDPMLATGGSAVAAIDLIKAAGARTIRMICIVAAPDGVAQPYEARAGRGDGLAHPESFRSVLRDDEPHASRAALAGQPQSRRGDLVRRHDDVLKPVAEARLDTSLELLVGFEVIGNRAEVGEAGLLRENRPCRIAVLGARRPGGPVTRVAALGLDDDDAVGRVPVQRRLGGALDHADASDHVRRDQVEHVERVCAGLGALQPYLENLSFRPVLNMFQRMGAKLPEYKRWIEREIGDRYEPLYKLEMKASKVLPKEVAGYVAARLYAGRAGRIQNRLDRLGDALTPLRRNGILEDAAKLTAEDLQQLARPGFTVRIYDTDHPVTRGVDDFVITDELYCLDELSPKTHVLAGYDGREVQDVKLTFRDGKVVDASASKGEDFLISMLDMDAGSRFLGECAIGTNYNITRYTRNTLFDENASSHIALGQAYSKCIRNGTNLTPVELAEKGANKSLIHIDWMIGSAEIDIDGLHADGTRVPVFRKGEWA